MLGWDSVPQREAARTPHDVPVVRGSPEFHIHGIRPLMHASALDLEGVVGFGLKYTCVRKDALENGRKPPRVTTRAAIET